MFQGDWVELGPKVCLLDNPGQNIWNKIEKPIKSGQGLQVSISQCHFKRKSHAKQGTNLRCFGKLLHTTIMVILKTVFILWPFLSYEDVKRLTTTKLNITTHLFQVKHKKSAVHFNNHSTSSY